MIRTLLALTAAAAVALPAAAAEPKLGPIEVKAVSVAGLAEAVAAHKGKVVVIDCWYLACAPCVKKFPYMIGVHKKLAKEGMQFMSLNVLPDELEEKDRVLAFLTKQEADCPNFIFQDKDAAIEKWQEKYEAEAAPALVVFDKTGEWVKVPADLAAEKDPEKYAAKMAEWVKQLLAK